MDSSTAHSPVFLVFPPEITASEYESTELSATTFSTQSPLQKLFATKMKILGVSKTCPYVYFTEAGERLGKLSVGTCLKVGAYSNSSLRQCEYRVLVGHLREDI